MCAGGGGGVGAAWRLSRSFFLFILSFVFPLRSSSGCRASNNSGSYSGGLRACGEGLGFRVSLGFRV